MKSHIPKKQGHVEDDRRSISDQKSHSVSTSQGGGRRTAGDKKRPLKRHRNNGQTLSLPEPPILSRPDFRLIGCDKIQNTRPSESAVRPSKARVKGSKASLDQSSRILQPLRRSERIAKRLHNIAIPLSGSINSAGLRSRHSRR
jgi:hypothetical protein